jgi:hypothetical protein
VLLLVALGLAVAVGLRWPRPPDEEGLSAPVGTRWLGSGAAAIAVPESWSSDRTDCLAILGPAFAPDSIRGCAVERRSGEDTVVVVGTLEGFGGPFPSEDATPIRIDGVDAELLGIACQRGGTFAHACSAAIRIPSEDVTFFVQSDRGVDLIHRLLDSVRVLPDGMQWSEAP